MHRIDSAGAVASVPATAAAGPIAGYWTKGNPAGGVPATVLDQDWLNSVQEELLAVLTQAAVTPSKTSRNQLLTSLGKLYGGGGTLGTTGWQKLPGGLLMQWTQLVVPTSTGVTWTYPVAFTSSVYNIHVTQVATGSTAETQFIVSYGLTTATFDNAPGANAQTCHMLAIGV